MTASQIKFNLHHVAANGVKARVYYSSVTLIDGRDCVTLYAKDYDRNLGKIFGADYINDTDSMTDYFDTGRVRIFPDSPHYAAAQAAAAALTASRVARFDKRRCA